MTVLERCTNVRAQIVKRNEIRRAHKDAAGFRERASELQTVREKLTISLDMSSVLRAKGLTSVRLPAPILARALLQECQVALKENVAESGSVFGRLKRSLAKYSKDIATIVDKAIDGVERELPAVEEAFLRLVELVPGYSGKVASIRQQRDALLSGIDPHVSSDALEQFLDRRESLQRLTDDLKPSEFPEDVLEFFRAGRHGGAPLEKLTDAVRKWLAERDLLKNVRITVISH